MKIVKLNKEGKPQTLLQAGSLHHKPAMSDEYCVCVNAAGLEDNGDPLLFRIVLTKNEIKYLHGLATQI